MDMNKTIEIFAGRTNNRNAIPLAMTRHFKVLQQVEEEQAKEVYEVPAYDGSFTPDEPVHYEFSEVPMHPTFKLTVLSDEATNLIIKDIKAYMKITEKRYKAKKELAEMKFKYKKFEEVAKYKKVESQIKEYEFLIKNMNSENKLPYNVIPRDKVQKDNLKSAWNEHLSTQLTMLRIKARLMEKGLHNIKHIEDKEIDILAKEQQLKELKTKKDNIKRKLRKVVNVGDKGIQLNEPNGKTLKFTIDREF